MSDNNLSLDIENGHLSVHMNASMNSSDMSSTDWNFDSWPDWEPFTYGPILSEFHGIEGIESGNKKRFSNSYQGGFDNMDHAFYYNTYEYGHPYTMEIMNSDSNWNSQFETGGTSNDRMQEYSGYNN